MPFDGHGFFYRLFNWVQDRDNRIPITASRFDAEDDDFAAAFNNCLTRDGQGSLAADLQMNGHKIINLGNGVNPRDALNLRVALDGNPWWGGTSTGTNPNAQTINLLFEPPDGLNAGLWVNYKIGKSNTGPSTLKVNTLTALPILRAGLPLAGGELVKNAVVELISDGTSFHLVGSGATSPLTTTARLVSNKPFQNLNFGATYPGYAPGEPELYQTESLFGIDLATVGYSAAGNVLVNADDTDFLHYNQSGGVITWDLRLLQFGKPLRFMNSSTSTSDFFGGPQGAWSGYPGATMVRMSPGEGCILCKISGNSFGIQASSSKFGSGNVGSTIYWCQLADGSYQAWGGPFTINASSTSTVSFASTPFATVSNFQVHATYNVYTVDVTPQSPANMKILMTYGAGAGFVVTNGNGASIRYNYFVTGLRP